MTTLDICIPAYDEEGYVGKAVRRVSAAFAEHPDLSVTVIVADNNSSDGTSEEARVAGARVVSVSTQGKGAAVRAAAAVSGADFFGFVDADLSAMPEDFLLLLPLLLAGEADIAIGSRLHPAARVERSFLRTLASRAFNALGASLLGHSLRDTQCGLKLMNPAARALLLDGRETGWFFDLELLACAGRAGLCICEVPVGWVEEAAAGRRSKLRILRDGVEGLRAIFRIRRRLAEG